MAIPRTTPFIFISLLFLLLHMLVPAIALPVQSRTIFARSLDTPSFTQHDTALVKRLTLIEAPHNPLTSSRVYARTFLNPHTPSPNGDTLTVYKPASKLNRRWWVFDKIREGFQNAGKKIKEGFQNFGNKVKQGFQKVKEGFQTAGRKIKEGFQTAGRKMKEGFQKAGTWIKDNAGKVAKFGLKIISTAASVAGHVVSFIPGIGKIVGKGLSGISKLANLGADKIKANLGAQLEKGMSVMNKIQNPVGGVVGKVLDAVFKRELSSTWKKDT